MTSEGRRELYGKRMYLRLLQREGIQAYDIVSFAYDCDLTWLRDGEWLSWQDSDTYGMLLFVLLDDRKSYLLALLNRSHSSIRSIHVKRILSMTVQESPQSRWPDAKSITLTTTAKEYLLFFKNSHDADAIEKTLQSTMDILIEH